MSFIKMYEVFEAIHKDLVSIKESLPISHAFNLMVSEYQLTVDELKEFEPIPTSELYKVCCSIRNFLTEQPVESELIKNTLENLEHVIKICYYCEYDAFNNCDFPDELTKLLYTKMIKQQNYKAPLSGCFPSVADLHWYLDDIITKTDINLEVIADELSLEFEPMKFGIERRNLSYKNLIDIIKAVEQYL